MEEGCLRGQLIVGAKWVVVIWWILVTSNFRTIILYIWALQKGKRGYTWTNRCFYHPVGVHYTTTYHLRWTAIDTCLLPSYF